MMKYMILLILFIFLFVNIANAGKPEWAGKGKSAKEEIKYQEKGKNGKHDDFDSENSYSAGKVKLKKERDNKKVKKGEDPKGLEKQKEKKSLQEQKELNKGSEKGKESRQKRKKWWKLWE